MLTLEQRCKITARPEVFQSPVEVQQRFWTLYKQNYETDRQTIVDTHWKFMETRSVMNKPKTQSGLSEKNVKTVYEKFVQNQEKSTQQASFQQFC
ncbi:hypothetical protein SK128_002743, partial [Halocaridina rubra]